MPMLIVLAVLLVALIVSWRREPRRMRIGVLLVLTILAALLTGAIEAPERLRTICTVIVLGGLVLLPIATLVTGVLLVGNGIVVLQHEQPTLGNAMSALTGLAILAVLAAMTIVVTRIQSTLALGVAYTAIVLVGYVSFVFVCFSAYALLYALRRRIRPVDGVVVLGSGLVGARVPPLLAARLQRSLDLRHAHDERGWPAPVIVPSGGRGPDEPEAEGEAMARWLHEHGAADRDVLPETEARTTEQNLVFGSRLLEAHGRGSRIAIVTNDYHSFRAALLARQLGLRADTFGARTAAYFVPLAYLREFVAVVRMHLRWHAAAMGTLTVVMALLTWESLRNV